VLLFHSVQKPLYGYIHGRSALNALTVLSASSRAGIPPCDAHVKAGRCPQLHCGILLTNSTARFVFHLTFAACYCLFPKGMSQPYCALFLRSSRLYCGPAWSDLAWGQRLVPESKVPQYNGSRMGMT
jgi:hypothetical protein